MDILNLYFKLLRKLKILITIFLSISFLLYTYTLVFAGINEDMESQFLIEIGWEQIEYKEYEPEKGLYSSAEVNNWVAGIEYFKKCESLFIGINAIIPVLQRDNKEEWFLLGSSYQINTLKYRWIRIDGYIGCPLILGLNPYGGVRWSESKQERTNFFVSGIPVDDNAIEIVNSCSLLLGIRADGNFTSRWEWNYWIEYFIPIDVKVKNSTLPDFEASEKDGYTLELKGGLKYSYTETLSFGFLIYGGRMHWEGSSWKLGGLAKWPENDTDYLGGALNVSWRF